MQQNSRRTGNGAVFSRSMIEGAVVTHFVSTSVLSGCHRTAARRRSGSRVAGSGGNLFRCEAIGKGAGLEALVWTIEMQLAAGVEGPCSSVSEIDHCAFAALHASDSSRGNRCEQSR